MLPFLEDTVAELLSGLPNLDTQSQRILLAEVEKVFTQDDNNFLLSPPTKDEIFSNICKSNLNASPGSDGLTALLYKECWGILGDSLLELACRVHKGEKN